MWPIPKSTIIIAILYNQKHLWYTKTKEEIACKWTAGTPKMLTSVAFVYLPHTSSTAVKIYNQLTK